MGWVKVGCGARVRENRDGSKIKKGERGRKERKVGDDEGRGRRVKRGGEVGGEAGY